MKKRKRTKLEIEVDKEIRKETCCNPDFDLEKHLVQLGGGKRIVIPAKKKRKS